ncbi:MAG: trigger factor [Dehalococcoidia bacterium]
MKVTTEKLPDSRMLLNIEVDGEEVERSLQKSYKKLVQRVKIPGFRPGKAPRAVLQSFVGKDTLLDEALDDLVPDVVKRAIAENDLDAIDAPEVEVANRSPVVVKATVPLKPTVELGDYKSIRLDLAPVEVTPEEAEKALEDLRLRKAPWEPVDRSVAFGDLLSIDLVGIVDGKEVIRETEATYSPTPELTYPVPGFGQQLENMKKAETKEFTLAMPDDYSDEELAGKECHFNVTVQEIKAKNPPPLDDDFARSVDDEYENLEKLREKIASSLQEHAEAEAESEYEDRLIEALKGLARIEAPPNLREREIDHLLMEEARSLAVRGIKFENYLRATGKTGEELREGLKEVAEKRVTTSLLLHRLAEVEEIKADQDEIEKEIKAIQETARRQGGEAKDQPQEGDLRSSVEHRILMRKALGLLKDVASGKEAMKAVTPEAGTETDENSEVKNET